MSAKHVTTTYKDKTTVAPTMVRNATSVHPIKTKPNKTSILTYWGKWQVRLAICAVLCAMSYYLTFEFEDDFPYLQDLKESIQNEQYNKDIDGIQADGIHIQMQ